MTRTCPIYRLWEIDGGYVLLREPQREGKSLVTVYHLKLGNLVRGLPSKPFENDQTYVAYQKGKQHRASYDYSRFTWVFFLATKDETSGILKSFITGIENLVETVDSQRVRTRIVEENLHIRFSESTPNVVGSGPDWLFDIDALTRIMNYEPIVAGTQSNGFADLNLQVMMEKKVDEDPRKDNECKDQEKEDNVNNTNNVNTAGNVNTVSSTVNAAGTNEVNAVGGKTSIELPFDLNMPA
ncbi:hypothetical protein Tco_1218011 [Tanacetum coccineum]